MKTNQSHITRNNTKHYSRPTVVVWSMYIHTDGNVQLLIEQQDQDKEKKRKTTRYSQEDITENHPIKQPRPGLFPSLSGKCALYQRDKEKRKTDKGKYVQ